LRLPQSKIFLGHHNIICRGDAGHRTKGSVPAPGKHDSHVLSRGNTWYYHANSLVNIADSDVRDTLHENFSRGRVWTGSCSNATHFNQKSRAKKLRATDWPKDHLGQSWPSSPSITEWIEMVRKGLNPSERPIYDIGSPNAPGFTKVSKRAVQVNLALASRIVSNNIVGIRSSVEVPAKYLQYFRYRQNFLILTASWTIPIGLVRFLISQWVQHPYSLWLRRAVAFKTFLKKVPTLLVKRASRWWRSAIFVDSPGAEGLVTPSDEHESDYESDAWSCSD